jgi:SpoIID/LytB domain protein
MPASWNVAAVQAQAIASRTYGRNAQENNSGKSYDICDTTQCQVYGGMTHYDANGNVLWTDDPAALSGNGSAVLQYGGKTIFAQFSASDGGWTVAGGEPYLVAKQDPYDNAASGDPYLNWTVTVNVSAIARYYGLTTVRDIVITQRDGNGQWGGRVLAAVVDGANAQGAQRISTTGFALQAAMNLPHNWFNILTANQMPIGHLDRISVNAVQSFAVFGWSFDPNHPDLPGRVALKIDGTIGAVQTTTLSRPDVQRVFGLQTSIVGFGMSAKVTPGNHTICLEAQDQDGGGFAEISCRTVSMPDARGSADIISAGVGSYRVAGWALDPDHKDLPGEFLVSVDGTSGPVQTTWGSRPDVQRAYGTSTALLGFDETRSISAGAHTICVSAVDRDGGQVVPIRCASVTAS